MGSVITRGRWVTRRAIIAATLLCALLALGVFGVIWSIPPDAWEIGSAHTGDCRFAPAGNCFIGEGAYTPS
jgi:hypothetical protein